MTLSHSPFTRTACRRDTLTKLQSRLDARNLPLLIFVNKGIEISTRALTLEIIADTCGKDVARVATFIVSIICVYLPIDSELRLDLVWAVFRQRK